MVSSDANAITVNADTLLSLTTTNTAGIAAPIIVSAGKSTGNGANAVFYGGDTSSSGNIGGRVTVTAGASTTSGKGGSVSIRGGAGSATGGGLTLVPGPTAAGTDGQIVILDAAGTPNRVIVVDDDVTTVTPVTFTTTVGPRPSRLLHAHHHALLMTFQLCLTCRLQTVCRPPAPSLCRQLAAPLPCGRTTT